MGQWRPGEGRTSCQSRDAGNDFQGQPVFCVKASGRALTGGDCCQIFEETGRNNGMPFF